MIRPLFAPYYQTCMCVGMILALVPAAFLVVFGDYHGGGEWFHATTSWWMLGLVVFNSIASGWIFLQLRRRGKKDQGPLTALACVTLLSLEYGTALLIGVGEFSVQYLLYGAFIFVVVAAVSSLVWYPVGLVVGKILEFAVGRDPTLRFGYIEPNRPTVSQAEASA